MHDRMLHAAAGFALRHERVLGIVGAIWFALGCASYARFIDLPRISFITDRYAFWMAGAWNGAWWGFVHPAIEQRKRELTGQGSEPVQGPTRPLGPETGDRS